MYVFMILFSGILIITWNKHTLNVTEKFREKNEYRKGFDGTWCLG